MQIVESDRCKCCEESRNARERKERRPYLVRESLKRKTVEWDHFSFRYISPPLPNKDLRSTHRQYRDFSRTLHRAPQISIALNNSVRLFTSLSRQYCNQARYTTSSLWCLISCRTYSTYRARLVVVSLSRWNSNRVR